jgi:molybdopterin converting factor subunit 1
MKVRVRLFASLAERVGGATEEVEVPDGTDVAGVWEALRVRHTGLAEVPFRPMAACDMEYASWDAKVDGVDEVAFLPPVSGG